MEGLILWGHKQKEHKAIYGVIKHIKKNSLNRLMIIGARPSVGKTSFALSLMNALYKNGYKPLLSHLR